MANYYIQHHGVKGMKWGIRKDRNGGGLFRRRGTNHEDYHEDYKKAHSKKSVKEMSDAELRARNNRLQMEKQYSDLTAKKSKGKQFVQAFVATAATVTSVVTAYNQYKKFASTAKPAADKILDKIGDKVLKGIDLTKPLA